MITTKEEYDNIKEQVARQRDEILQTRKRMDDLEILVSGLEVEVNAVKKSYELQVKDVSVKDVLP